MSTMRHALSIFVGLVLVVGIAIFVFKNNQPVPYPGPENFQNSSSQNQTNANPTASTTLDENDINFSETGNLVNKNEMRGNSELTLVYEKPGTPALTVDLVINEKSLCVFGTDPEREQISCMALSRTFSDGMRAKIEGVKNGNAVEVITFTSFEEN